MDDKPSSLLDHALAWLPALDAVDDGATTARQQDPAAVQQAFGEQA